jgi:hypothetical protein
MGAGERGEEWPREVWSDFWGPLEVWINLFMYFLILILLLINIH